MSNLPCVAVEPPTLDPRIVAQQGKFTIHDLPWRDDLLLGKLENGGETRFTPPLAVPFSIKSEERTAILNGLELMGIRRPALFPDLDALGLSLWDQLALLF